MTINKRYEILDSLPAYGPMYVSVAEDDKPFYSEGFPVRFYKPDGTEWVANFKPGWSKLNRVFDFPQHNRTIVVAGGLGYLMKTDSEKPLETFGLAIEDIIEIENRSLVFEDSISIIIIDGEAGEMWTSERISIDGFKDLKLIGDVLYGLSYDPTNSQDPWTKFSLNLKTKEIKGGSYRELMLRNTHLPKVRLKDENKSKKLW
jgi:hypothetical protein